MSDTLLDLQALIPDLAPAVERRELGDRLTIITNTLREFPGEIERLDALLDIAALTKFAADLAELRDDAADAAEALKTAQKSDELREAKDAFEALRKTLARVGRQVTEHWRSIVEREFRPLIAFGMLLERVDNLADLGRRMQSCAHEALASKQNNRLSDLRPIVRRLMLEAERLHTERAASVGAIPGVGDFLSAVGDQRATLALVTPAVLDWLKENGALENFKVSA
ncbi:hypothetical protein RZS28_11060 [Methylocapsa polymorpha]|uniref:Uncharacterized protein n=1 Tax=Methylocapsa polymorpha TaxID=3080828 RepID=A0ABZ0HMJ3_9HYPH|nr:hypothetical protein RZS28_11060 [Methylocapsa sp. RX1]